MTTILCLGTDFSLQRYFAVPNEYVTFANYLYLSYSDCRLFTHRFQQNKLILKPISLDRLNATLSFEIKNLVWKVNILHQIGIFTSKEVIEPHLDRRHVGYCSVILIYYNNTYSLYY